MKNDMKLIMESWRNSDVLNEEEDFAMKFVQNIDPIELPDGSIGQFLQEVTKVITGGKSFVEVLESGLKKLDDAVDEVEDRKVIKFLKTGLKFAFGRGLGYAMGTLLAPFTGGSSLIITALMGEVFAGGLEKLTELGVEQLENLRTSLNIPDSERANYKTADLWDINDDLVKIIAGADKDFSRKEFTAIASVYIKILKAIKEIDMRVRSSYDQGNIQYLKTYLQSPLDQVLKWDEGSANAAAQKNYSDTIGLSNDYTIQKNPSGPT